MSLPPEAIKVSVKKLLEVMGFTGEVTIDASATPLHVHVSTPTDSHRLIGKEGQNLRALQHVARAIIRQQSDEEIGAFTLDINGYRSHHEQIIRALAEKVAQQATRSGQAVAMEPMSAADRRLVHTSLATRTDIRTESLGQEPNRRVLVRPVFI